MNFEKCIIESGKKLENSGLTVETWGNISVRNPETGLVCLTPSAMKYSIIVEDDVMVYRLGGTIVEGHRKPTIETGLHLAMYRNREKVDAVIHTRPMCLMVYTTQGKDIPLIISEAAQAMGDTCKYTQCTLPGSEELADQCERALRKEADSCLLHSHGAICVGENMDATFKVATVLEATARILHMIEATGGEPTGISSEDAAVMKDFAKNHYGRGKQRVIRENQNIKGSSILRYCLLFCRGYRMNKTKKTSSRLFLILQSR